MRSKSPSFKILKYCLRTWNNTFTADSMCSESSDPCTSLNCSHSGLSVLKDTKLLPPSLWNTIPCAWNAFRPLWLPLAVSALSFKAVCCILWLTSNLNMSLLKFLRPDFIHLVNRERFIVQFQQTTSSLEIRILPSLCKVLNTDGLYTVPGTRRHLKVFVWINRQQAMCNLQFASLYHYM